MPDYKCVFNFFSSGKKGGTWSETWYRSAVNMGVATYFSDPLLYPRLNMMSPLSQLTKIRVSQVGNPRVTAIVQLNRQGTHPFATTPAPIDSAIVCNVSSSVIPATRRWWLRGWDSEDAFRDNVGGNDVFTAYLRGQLVTWFTQLNNAGFEILPVAKTNNVQNANYPVSQIDGTAGNGQAVLTVNNPAFWTVGNTLILTRFSKKDLPGLNGRFTVLNTTNNVTTIPYVVPGNQKMATPGAQLRLLTYVSGCTIDPYISGPSFIGGRQTRSPFTGSRGARSANRRLRLSP